MSLQVWLPLNGNLNNQGLSGYEMNVITPPSYVDTGKIGKAISTGDFYLGSNQIDKIFNNTELSISFWIYPHSNTGSGVLFGNASVEANGGRKFSIFLYPTVNDLHLSWFNEPGGDAFISDVWGGVFPSNQWTHCCITYKNPNCFIYINGTLKYTSFGVSNSSSFAYNTMILNNANNRYINDFRIYDRCLSAKEVKEISKGLVCHYKLDNKGFGNPNILPTYSSPDFSRQGNKYTSKVVDTRTNDPLQLQYFIGSTYDSTFYSQDVYATPYNVETTFTVPTSITRVGVKFNGASKDIDLFNASQVPVTPGETYTLSLRVLSSKSGIVGGIQVENPKLEKGSVATPWCPHTSDSLYTSLGLDSTTELDCSGYGYNGTKIGGLSSSTDPVSIRYESCYNFDGNTGSIQIPNLSTLVPSGEFTMNCWIYHDDTWSSKGYETILGGPSGFELEAKVTSTNSPVLYAFSWGQGEATYELNKWNMITMTRNASETKFYINGELKITGSAGTIPSGDYFIGAWNTSSQQNFKGKISDFRLYSTVLSEEDIKMLYNTSASIDKNGNMYAYEFKEV